MKKYPKLNICIKCQNSISLFSQWKQASVFYCINDRHKNMDLYKDSDGNDIARGVAFPVSENCPHREMLPEKPEEEITKVKEICESCQGCKQHLFDSKGVIFCGKYKVGISSTMECPYQLEHFMRLSK